MNIFSRVFGKLVYFLAVFFEKFFTLFINIFEFVNKLVKKLRQYIVSFLLTGFMIIMFLFISPIGFIILPFFLPVMLFLVIIPILAENLVEFNRKAKYTMSNYLYERSAYFIEAKEPRYETMKEYGYEYRRKKEEKEREEARRKEEEFRQKFRSYYGDFSGFDFEDFFRGENWQWNNQGQGGSNQGTFYNPRGFKEEFEKYCDILEIPYNSDKNAVKSAFRKKAKEYHPDLNKEAGATEKFQKINEANEFLSEENIDRYSRM